MDLDCRGDPLFGLVASFRAGHCFYTLDVIHELCLLMHFFKETKVL